jgi:hypothetical protein
VIVERRIWQLGVVSASLIVVMACGGSGATGTAPTPTPVISELQIDVAGGSVDATAGGTAQLQARAIFMDGSTAIVTGGAAWASLSPEVATVKPTGLVTFVAGGPVIVRATYLGLSADRTFQVRGRSATVTATYGAIEALDDCDGIFGGRGDFVFLTTFGVQDQFTWEYTSRLQLGSGETSYFGLNYTWHDVLEQPGALVRVTFEATEYDNGSPDPRMNGRKATVNFTWTAAGGWSPAPGQARQITLGASGCSVRLHYEIDVK